MAVNLFTTNKTASGTLGASLYVDLGLIPTGVRIFVGNAQYADPTKNCTWELRTNALTKTLGNDANTTSMAAATSITARNGTYFVDYYKNNTLHKVSVVSTGVEHWWLKITSKSSTSGTYSYSINYTVE